MVKVYQGKKGGKYVVQGGRKKYLKSLAGMSRVRGTGKHDVPRRQIRGRGGYKDWLGTALRGVGTVLGGVAGAASGGPWGMLKGASMGAGLTGAASGILGLGDYRTKANSLLGLQVGGASSSRAGQMPKVGGSKSFIVSHSEFLGDVSGSTDFENMSYPINPGLSETFPWLSTIAQNFEQWRPRGIVFKYVTTSSDALNSTNTALGTVTMATNYNATQAQFTSKTEMLNSLYVCEGKPSCDLLHPVECAKKQNSLDVFYVRSTVPPNFSSSGPTSDNTAVDDLRFSDLGLFQVATSGQQSGTDNVIGELWVCYEIEFLKPVFSLDASNQNAIYQFTNTASNLPFGAAKTDQLAIYDNIGINFVQNSTPGRYDTVILPQSCIGLYLVFWMASNSAGGSFTAPVPQTALLTPGSSVLQGIFPGGLGTLPPAGALSQAAASHHCFSMCAVNIPIANEGNTALLFNNYAASVASTYSTMVITNMNDLIGVQAGSLLDGFFDAYPDLKKSILELRRNRKLRSRFDRLRKLWIVSHNRDHSVPLLEMDQRRVDLFSLFEEEKIVHSFFAEGWVPSIDDIALYFVGCVDRFPQCIEAFIASGSDRLSGFEAYEKLALKDVRARKLDEMRSSRFVKVEEPVSASSRMKTLQQGLSRLEVSKK